MKTTLVTFLAISCILSVSNAADEKPAPDAVVVKVLDKQLPSDDRQKDKFLWDNYSSNPNDKQFGSYSTQKWEDNFEIFAKALVQKTADQKLDSKSLRKALDLVFKYSADKIAYLPVAVYQTTLDNSPVWLITVKWEYLLREQDLKKFKDPGLGHIRIFALDQKTLKKVGFVTCM